MKRYFLTLAVLVAGCETNETSMTITHVVLPDVDETEGTCALEADGEAVAGPITLDTLGGLSLAVPFSVTNNLAPRSTDFSPNDVEQPVNTASEITPTRFASRFECDTSAYSGARVSGLILPRLDPQDSFCVDSRSEASASNVNSDILPAYGAALPPGGAGTAIVRAIPHELGYAIDELFRIAVFAEDCCRASPNCSGSGGSEQCQLLQDIFTGLDGTGSLMAITNGTATNPKLQMFADYAIYDGATASLDPAYANKPTPTFPMFMRGQLQGITGYGEVVESNDYSLAIELCRGCGINGMPKTQAGDCIHE